jgi:hypothetical protein
MKSPGVQGFGAGGHRPGRHAADGGRHPTSRTAPSCSEGGQRSATGGTVAYTTVTDTLVEGRYDLQFGSSTVQGAFSAPMCLLCAPRPTSQTCLKQ